MLWSCGRYGRRVSCDILYCATKILNRQMLVHFKRNSCDIMVSQRCCVLSDIIWTYFCHFLHRSRAKFIKKIVNVGRTTTFCMTTTRFMSQNLVVQSCMTELLSVWTHLKTSYRYFIFFILMFMTSQSLILDFQNLRLKHRKGKNRNNL